MSYVALYTHQLAALEKLRSGSVLCGGVGTGKSLTALAYYVVGVCGGAIAQSHEVFLGDQIPLYIITTARKRDTGEWDGECTRFGITGFTVDSWNNIGKYEQVKGAFFIFDEQRVVGSGAWVRHFLKITKCNKWLLLSATPGDTWMDYIPVFVANGYYKNRTEFLRRHAVFSRFAKYPKVERWLETSRLQRLRRELLVPMKFDKETEAHYTRVPFGYDRVKYDRIAIDRWDVYANEPIRDISRVCYLLRRVVNENRERVDYIKKLMEKHSRIIVFYNFDYELDILKHLSVDFNVRQWNGHVHEPVPNASTPWIYLVQYTAGAEGWNCIYTDTIVFFSRNYSYKIMHQAAGRIDRLNTPFHDLHYYIFETGSSIDRAIARAVSEKRTFNEKVWIEQQTLDC